MNYFAFYMLGLVVTSVLVVATPLWLRRKRQQQNSLSNVQVVKGRLAELEREVQEGLLSAEDKAQAEKELKLALVEETTETGSKQSGVLIPAFVGGAIALVTGVGIYLNVNQIDKLERLEQAVTRLPELGKRVVIEADPSIGQKDLEDFALGIRTKLVDNPDDYTGWLLLGRLYASLNRLQSAIDAYEKGLKLNPQHPALLSSYSRSLLMTGDEAYVRTALTSLTRLVSISPGDIEAHSMLAIAATQLGNKELALTSWRTLADALPAEHARYQAVLDQIAELEGKTRVAEVVADDAVVNGPEILVNVELAQELQTKLPDNGYLFVFAQAADGSSRMPAAVSKTRLAQLPVQISLSNANAMIASYNLSQLSEARLVARISADENVAQAAGELQGELLIKLEQDGVMRQLITIDKELL